MNEPPTLLCTHRVGAERGRAIADGVRDRVPDADVAVAATPAETVELAADADALVTYGMSRDALDRGDVRWMQVLSAGVDSYDLDELQDRGVALTNASGVHAEPIGEQVLGYMLSFERRLHELDRQRSAGVWERREGGELRGKTLGIVGVGAIGGRVAELGGALGMTVLGTKRDTGETPAGVDELFGPDRESLHEVCRRADYLVLACPLTDETEQLVGMDELRLLGEEGVLVNVARGAVVDQDALVRALRYHVVGGAALDVFETEPLPDGSPLWDLSNVLLTPHMAGSTPHKVGRWVDIVAPNYRRLRAGDVDELENRIV